MSKILKEMKLSQIKRKSQNQDPARIARSKNVKTKYIGISKFGILNFKTSSETKDGHYYQTVEFKDIKPFEDIIKQGKDITPTDVKEQLKNQDVNVYCDDPSFSFWAWGHQAYKRDFLYMDDRIPNLNKMIQAPTVNNVRLNGGACFVAGTKVATDKGFKNIEDIEIGDLVYTHKGRLKPVTHKFKRISDTVDVNVRGTLIQCTPDHKFLTNDNWKEIKDFTKDDKVESLKINIDESINVDLDKAFFMGLYLGDGSAHFREILPSSETEHKYPVIENYSINNIRFAYDKNYIDGYKKVLESYNIETNFNLLYENGNTKEFSVNNPELIHFINEYGGFTYGPLNLQKEIKSTVLNWNSEAQKELLKGFFATDGTLGNSSNGNKTITFYNTNEELLYMLYLIARKYFKPTWFKMKRKSHLMPNGNICDGKDLCSFRLTGKDAEAFYNELGIITEMKKSTNKDVKFGNVLSRISKDGNWIQSTPKITTSTEKEVYDIEVEDDHSFCVSYKMIIVHNCKHLLSVVDYLNTPFVQLAIAQDMNKFLSGEGEDKMQKQDIATQNQYDTVANWDWSDIEDNLGKTKLQIMKDLSKTLQVVPEAGKADVIEDIVSEIIPDELKGLKKEIVDRVEELTDDESTN